MAANAGAARHDHLIEFRPDVEGLRAVAVLSVVVFHLGATWLPGGFVGVDVFFVISGFLISSLLQRRLAAQQFSVADFYAARVRRIFPALFVVLLASTAAAHFTLPPADAAAFGRTVRSTAWFFSNVELNGQTGYFDGAAELKPLLHTWSLAVEEQFYLVYPLLLALLAARMPRALPLVLAGLALLSLGLSAAWASKYPSLGFYSALTRAHELLVGAWIAAVDPRPRHPAASHLLGLAGALAIAVPLLTYSGSTPFPGTFAILPCLGVALLIVAGHGRAGWSYRLLSLAPVRFVGAISYSLYLWHWPLLAFARHHLQREPGAGEKVLLLAAMLGISTLCWRFVERPARATRMRTRPLLALGLAAMLVATLAGEWIVSSGGLDARFGPESRAYFAAARDFNPRREECHASDARPIGYVSRCVFGEPPKVPGTGVAFWADSHGAELAYTLGEAAARQHRSVAQISYSTCPPAIGFQPAKIVGCAQHNDSTLRALSGDPGVGTVVLAAHYAHYLEHDDGPAFLAGMAKSVALLRAAGKQVVLVGPVPTYDYPVPQALGMRVFRGADPVAFGQPQAEHRHRTAAATAAIDSISRASDPIVVDPARVLCDGGRCVTSEPLRPLYFDNHHLSLAGAARVTRDLAAALAWKDIGSDPTRRRD